jgi:hypothetical protein
LDLGDFDMRWAHITAVSATERQDTMVSIAQMQMPPVQHIYYSIAFPQLQHHLMLTNWPVTLVTFLASLRIARKT